jgi:hypothetical protein
MRPQEPTQAADKAATVPIKHVRLWSATPFADVVRRIAAARGLFDGARLRDLLVADASPQSILDEVAKMAGASGFMRFAAFDHGAIPRLEGHPIEAIRYLLRHPRIAARMTRREIRSALYTPLRLLVAANRGGTRIEYDRPSSLLGQFRDHGVAEVAAELDANVAAVIAWAADFGLLRRGLRLGDLRPSRLGPAVT